MKGWLTSVLLLAAVHCPAQWSLVGGGFQNGQIHDLEYQQDSGQLYLGGTIRYVGDPPVQINGIGYYAAGCWHALNGGVSDTVGALVSPVFSIGTFDESILIAGSFKKVDWQPSTSYVAEWRSGEWYSMGIDSSAQALSLVRSWRNIDGKPHLFGGMDWTIDDVEIKSWAAWDIDQWVPGDTAELFPFGYSGQINQVVDYNGQRYVGGNFQHWNVPNDLALLNVDTWEEVGPGIQGDAWVNDLEVFDGKLWVAGEFFSAAGNAATGLMTWDGTQWADPFPQIESTAAGLELLVANDKLYFCGPFMAQGLPGVYRIAAYDGEHLCVIGTNEIFQVRSLAASPDTLFAYVYPWEWDRQNIGAWPLDAPADTCYTIVQSVQDDAAMYSGTLSVFPNPASNTITVRTTLRRDAALWIVDPSGRMLRSADVDPSDQEITLSLEGLAAGCYQVVLRDQRVGHMGAAPFVKMD